MSASLPTVSQLVSSLSVDHATDLDRVRAAVIMADELGALGDEVVTHFVEAARKAGCSWSQIGGELGVSKQAAQQAFVAPPPRRRRFGRHDARRPFARFTDRARAAIEAARAEAVAMGHNYVGTEHLLLGLCQGDGLAATALARLGITQDAVRRSVEEIVGTSPATATSGRRPFSPRTKRVLELAVREAARLHHDHLGTEHLLLALAREGDGVAAQILVQRLGVDLPRVSRTVDELLTTAGPRTPGERPTG